MDGIVEYLREGLEGSQTVIGRTVITLKDPNDMYFYASDRSAIEYLSGLESVVISVNGSSAAEYEAKPYSSISPFISLSIALHFTGNTDYTPK